MSTNKLPDSSGSSFEKAGKKRQNLPLLVVVFLVFHAVVLGGILWVGCKPHKTEEAAAPPPSPLPPIGGGQVDSNAFFPPIEKNLGSPVEPVPPPGPTAGGPLIGTPIPVPPQNPVAPAPSPSPVPAPAPAPTPPTTAGPVSPSPIATPPPPVISTPSVPAGGMSATAAPTAPKTYRVQKGDTYYSIAGRHNTTMNALKEANPGVDPRRLQLNQALKIPAAHPAAAAAPAANDPSIYEVKSGDMLGKIANRYKTTVDRLREVNGLTSDRIRVGQKLKLPPEAKK